MLNRRHLLKLTGTLAAATAMPTNAVEPVAVEPARGIIDTNVSLFAWPFRRLPLDDTDRLMQKLRQLGVRQAWAGSFDGLLHRDIAAVNQRLAAECQKHPELVPIGSVNPTLPAWEDDVRCCAELHRMSGIRLHPGYHGYTLQDERCARLLQLAEKANLFVQIAVAMEDTRTQHPQLQVPDVDLRPLLALKLSHPGARIQILNHRLQAPLLLQLAELPNLYFDTARVESTDGVPQLVTAVPAGRILYGSHAPLLIPEAALIRVHESGQLTESELEAVYTTNAATLTGRHAL